ncbi:unnamed protein product [Leptidea sinapis]|uniref:Sulfatase-modifying factor enzyme-like domain-containing protein n=1 Tax=Leptidea sinapis TaxID=189913 RepID=A0A5E4QI65_9NEOP|nr:unnamed protein product [Leptidea sinapis]
MFVAHLSIFVLCLGTVLNENSGCGCSLNRDSTLDPKANYLLSTANSKCHRPEQEQNDKTMVLVPSGVYQVGTDDIVIETDQEGPRTLVKISSFYIDKYEVSNRDFSNFIKSTNYETEAERFGDSFVFTIFLNNTYKEMLKDFRVAQATWWYKVKGANWKHPHGSDSDLEDLMDHPVIHVSWNDAQAYCKWRDGRLPTEAEWEAACRGGLRDIKYPWGDKLFPNHTHKANIWQGTFPNYNSAKDGFIGTNPVNLFSQNDFGIHNMAGNVWEWTEDGWSKDKVAHTCATNLTATDTGVLLDLTIQLIVQPVT